MAEKHMRTTSSSTLDGNNESKTHRAQPAATPSAGSADCSGHRNVQILTRLANNLSESYQLVKQRQQKYNDLNAKLTAGAPRLIGYRTTHNAGEEAAADSGGGGGEWQEVTNKLKRKKKLSASLTSVNDTVNQEKRTRIEGIQLNCRGKLQITEVPAAVPLTATRTSSCAPQPLRAERSAARPPAVPPSPTPSARQAQAAPATTTTPTPTTVPTVPPPRLKRKLQENVQTIQKLNALTEQLRLEINELKSSLTTERAAVRVLRAQNESETRKWRNEVKKLQNVVELMKKNQNQTLQSSSAKKPLDSGAENLPTNAAAGSLANHEIQRLTSEIIALKEANKALEEKKVINGDADRRKAADMRTLKDSYEIRLTQLTKSAKTEISRLLEELKTKERNIGQLKKELQILQTKPQQPETKQSRNATTNQTKNKTTKPKKNYTKNTTKKINEKPEVPAEDVKKTEKEEEDNKEHVSQAQHPNEVKKLKDIELINNTQNIQNNLKATTTTTTTTIHTTTIATKILNNINSQNLKLLKPLENVQINHENHENIIQNSQSHEPNCNNLLKTANITTTATTNAYGQPKGREYHSLPHELTEEHLMGRGAANMGTATKTETKQQQQQQQQQQERNDANEYRSKDNNSDSDSALSSAPPSISPQPPPAGLDTADIWQMIRTYSTDLEKLQKDNEILQKENEHLHSELSSAKEQILESEKVAMETNNSAKLQQLMERLKQLEEQEYQLRNEADELREQNELLEFRILELEETNDKWSLQSHATPSSASTISNSATVATAKDVWACGKSSQGIEDPMQLLFGSHSLNMDSGITSPHSQQHIDDELNLVDLTNEELRRRIGHMLKKTSLDEEDKQCLQQVLQLDLLSQRSGPNSLNTTSCSSDDASSLDLAKSRISDYSSASSSSSARSAYGSAHHSSKSSVTKSIVAPPPAQATSSSRIVATVPPYNSCPQQPPTQQQHTSHQPVPTNTPTDSPRKSRHAWQSNSLSESGVFVESDFLSDASEHNACTQTDFEDESVAGAAKDFSAELQRLQRYDVASKAVHKVPAYSPQASALAQLSPNLGDQKRLQYYKERLALLENKVLIYESSGDLQAKRLADRLQREIQLEKQLKELRDRVEFLESENAALEEEKCEFEEAENDTRLRLQRLEVELEILSQRNVELEMSREALSAKYKDCRSECLILREDLSASETQVRHLEEDKQKAKENLELLHSLLPLLLIYNTTLAVTQLQREQKETSLLALPTSASAPESPGKMGNSIPRVADQLNNMMPLFADNCFERTTPIAQLDRDDAFYGGGVGVGGGNANEGGSRAAPAQGGETCVCSYLKDEVKCLRRQLRELNSRHYEAMESADSHWVELERGYKDREEAFRAKECCLKVKIQKLQDCLRDDARAANEKILQLEEAERELKSCLVRVSKEHRDILEEHQSLIAEYESFREQYEKLKEQQKPLLEGVEKEKKRCKAATDELSFMRKLQAELEARTMAEAEEMRKQMFDLRKDFLHVEVTNSELKEEVATLEQTIHNLQVNEKEWMDKIRVLQDEVRSKEEMAQKLEKRLERSEGYSLAQELNGSPSKRFKREDVKDLKTASTGLANALRNFKECEDSLPSHQQFSNVARNVKKLADTLLFGDEEIVQQIEDQINEELMSFHNKRMESEFYCTVYYPVKRQALSDIKNFVN